jgi:hypothetical protein
MRVPFLMVTLIVVSSLCGAYSRGEDNKTMKAAADYLSKLRSWRTSSDVNAEALASLRALYITNALETLKRDYDGSALEAIVLEINQNNSISIWVETTQSREGIVTRFRKESIGYEGQSDAEILDNITPWYYDAFKYACLEFTCTGVFKALAKADMELCESDIGADLETVSRDATIDAILILESSGTLAKFERSPGFEVRVFSEENDTISPGEHCWATNKLLAQRRKQKKS